jgi:glutamine synthetase
VDFETAAKTEKVRRDVLHSLKNADIEITSLCQNDQNGPFTVVLKESSVLRIADNIMTLKYMIQNVAQRYGLYASFMPKPQTEAEGLTTSFGFILMKDEFNEFYHPGKDMMISDNAQKFIGGIFNHIRGICAVTNPTVNSYKRIIQKGKAPYYISWSVTDRYSLIRLPSLRGRLTKIEVQNADSSCNPYLSLLALLSAGMAGIENSAKVINASSLEVKNFSHDEKAAMSAGNLPITLYEAVEEFKKDSFLKQNLGESISTFLIQSLTSEWEDYSKHVHLWELEKYL